MLMCTVLHFMVSLFADFVRNLSGDIHPSHIKGERGEANC